MTTAAAAHSESPATLRDAGRRFVRHASPLILIGALALAVLLRASLGPPTPRDLLPALGLLLYWPFQEWLIHVFLLHAKPFTLFGRHFDLALAKKHRAHHADPTNVEILFIPLGSYLLSVPALALLWLAVTPDVTLAATGIALHLTLALRYEWVHFLIHTRYRPRTPWFRRLWHNHRLHHFRNERHWYGVTMLSGDRLLRTGGDEASVEPSATCRTLGLAG